MASSLCPLQTYWFVIKAYHNTQKSLMLTKKYFYATVPWQLLPAPAVQP